MARRSLKLPSWQELVDDPSLVSSLPSYAVVALRDALKAELASGGLGATPEGPAEFAARHSQGAFLIPPHIQYLSDRLARAYRTGGKVIISLPPGHGKSSLCSVWLPLWVLAQAPHKLVGLVGHTDLFAADWGFKVRQLVQDLSDDLKLKLDPSRLARDNWRLVNGGGMTTEGVEGGLTGKRLHVLVIDDPLKDEVEASSALKRQRMVEWWETVASTRLEPGACVVVIGTRWHEDDLLGHLTKKSQKGIGFLFDVVTLPALAERGDPLGRKEGEALWPDRFPVGKLHLIRDGGMSPYNFAALYQQRPVPAGGGRVQRDWWRFYSPASCPREFDFTCQSWDLSLKAGLGSDPAVGQVWGRKGACYYLLAQVRGTFALPVIVEHVRQFQLRYPQAVLKLVEDKAAGPALVQTLQRETPGVVAVKVKDSKEARLEAVLPVIQAGNVFLPEHQDGTKDPWVWEFIEEWAAFPKGTHDDQIDAGTMALIRLLPQGWALLNKQHGTALDENTPPLNPEEESRKGVGRWRKAALARHDDQLAEMEEAAYALLESPYDVDGW